MDSFELSEATIADLQQGMVSGKWSAALLTQQYLERIDALDRQGPGLHSVIEVNPDALSIAQELDKERQADLLRGPLHGIPVLLKDNIDTADGMTTTAGSLALEGSRPKQDSVVAQRLRAAGAVLIGKTNMSEWANFRSSRSVSGWSGRGGQCRNPYALDRSPSGSSSGTGSAIAANFAAVGVGTETSGSIVSPSSACCLVGIKPTHGLIPQSGVIPLSPSLDTAGPMTRTVRDAAILLHILSGQETPLPDVAGLRGARLGVLRSHFGTHPGVARLIAARIAEIEHLGAIIVDPVEVSVEDTGVKETILYEFRESLNSYLHEVGKASPLRSLKALIEFNERHAAQEMLFFEQDLLIASEQAASLPDIAYMEAQTKRQQVKQAMEDVFARHQLDALVAPTGNPAWLIDWVNGDALAGWPDTSSLAAAAGWPHLTAPAGFLFGLPVGLSFIGRPYSEPLLLRLAYAFEQAVQCRQLPPFRAAALLSE